MEPGLLHAGSVGNECNEIVRENLLCNIRYSWLEVALLYKVIQHPLRGSVYASNVKCAHVCLYIFLVNCFGDEFTSEQSWLGGQNCFDSE